MKKNNICLTCHEPFTGNMMKNYCCYDHAPFYERHRWWQMLLPIIPMIFMAYQHGKEDGMQWVWLFPMAWMVVVFKARSYSYSYSGRSWVVPEDWEGEEIV